MNKSLPLHSHVCWPKKKKKKEARGEKIRGKNKSMSWIIQWLGCTPKVSALWPLWQEVKWSAVADGKNEADVFSSLPKTVCKWQWKLRQDVRPHEDTIKPEFTHCPSDFCRQKKNRKKNPNFPRLKVTFEPRQSEWLIFSHLSTTCAALLQNPCIEPGQCI